MNVDVVGSRRNGPQLSTRHVDDDDDDRWTRSILTPSIRLVGPYSVYLPRSDARTELTLMLVVQYAKMVYLSTDR